MEKIMKAIGLIVALGVVGIFALTALVEFNLEGQADKGTPFIIESMPTITTWDTEQYQGLFIPEVIEEFKSVEGQSILTYLSKLGKMQSFEPPEFVKKDFTMKSTETEEDFDFSLSSSLNFNGIEKVIKIKIVTLLNFFKDFFHFQPIHS